MTNNTVQYNAMLILTKLDWKLCLYERIFYSFYVKKETTTTLIDPFTLYNANALPHGSMACLLNADMILPSGAFFAPCNIIILVCLLKLTDVKS